MKKFTSVLVVLTMLITSAVMAQSEYKVLTKVGDVTVTKNKSTNSVAVGNFIKGDFNITLADNAYVGLIDGAGKVLELKEKGSYSTATLDKMIAGKSGSSLTTKYANYLLNRSENDIKNQLKATGAVEREIKSEDASIHIWLPEKTNVLGDRVTMTWEDPDHDQFRLVISNLYEETLATYKVNGHEFDINLNAGLLANKDIVLIKVFAVGDKDYSNTVALQRLSDDARKEHLRTIDSMIQTEDGALAEYIKAAYFMENKLYADALTSFAKAARLAPGVESYRSAYAEWSNAAAQSRL